MTIQACKDYLCKLLAYGILFSQLDVTDATITWTLPPPQRGPLQTSDTSVRTTIQQVINGSCEAHLTWNFTLSGEIYDRSTFKIGNTRIGRKSSSGVSIDPILNFQEHFDISRSDPATLIIHNVTEADETVFSCIIETNLKEWTDEIEVQIVVETSFTSSPSGDKTLNEGSNLTLFCDATGKPTPNVTWTRVLKNGTDGDVVFFGNPWVIVNISRTATGTYRCTAYNGIGTPVSHSLYVNVTYQPDNVTMVTNTTENKDCSDLWVNFTCISSEANPPVYNYLLSDDEDGFSFRKSGSWIKKISRGGKSVFNCIAYQLVQNVTSTNDITLTVNVPLAMEQAENKTVQEGDNVEVYCNVTADIPDPTVIWRKVQGGGYSLTRGKLLNITNISRAQAGEYRCTANNTCGEQSTVTSIDVQYLPENVLLTTNTTSKVCTGVVIHFTCTAEANPAVHTYVLFENDTVIRNMGISGTWMKTMETAGQFVFRCEANNSIQGIGKSVNTILTIDVPASVEQVENKVVKGGENVEVYCNVTAGIPDPSVFWTKVATGEDITGNPLNITNITRAQAGEYRCTANNTCGVDSTVVDIDVQDSPTITRKGHIIDVSEGSPASVSCPVLGNPQPNITWYKGNDTSSGTMISITNTLEFLETVLDDSGWYTCFAENYLGNVTVTVQLRVEKSAPTTVTTLPKPTTKENTIFARATIDKNCDERLDVEERFPSLACERVRDLGCLSAQAVASRCGSVIVDFEMKFNQSAVVIEVLNVLKTAAKENNFDGFKVDPNSIEQVSAAPTDTSGTKAAEECKCSCNDVIWAAVVGVLVFIILGLILYIVWLQKKGTAGKQRRYKEERGVYDNEMALDDLEPSSFIPSKSTQPRSEYMDLTEATTVNDQTQRVAQSPDYAPLHPSTRSWEVEKQHVTIEKIIGKGAFGQVAKATATGLRGGRAEKTTVAVKMLKYNSPESDRRDLLRELDTMKQLKPHPHVIKLLGCVTETGKLYKN